MDSNKCKCFLLKMGHSLPLFFIFVFSIIQLVENLDCKVWTAGLWCQKRPLYQLSHNHCPEPNFYLQLLCCRALKDDPPSNFFIMVAARTEFFFLTFMIFSSSSLEPWALREFQATTSICRNVKIMHFLCRNISFGCGASRAYRTFLLKGGRRRLEGSTCFNRNSFCPSSHYPIFARNAAL